MSKPRLTYVREDKQASERLDFEEEVVRKCLGRVRTEYTKLQGEWLVLIELFEKATRQEAALEEEESKKGHEKLEKMYTTLKGMKKSRRRPMKIVEVDDVGALKSMMNREIDESAFKQETTEVPAAGPSSEAGRNLFELITNLEEDEEMAAALSQVDEEAMNILNGIDIDEMPKEKKEANFSDYETESAFDNMDLYDLVSD